MAKKRSNKRPNVSQEALERARRELRGEPSPSKKAESKPAQTNNKPAPAAKASAPPSGPIKVETPVLVKKRMMTREELAQEYGYVINDLSSMAVLAAILFVAMIVVSILVI